ncbi:MAG TPA: oxygenase MpaB family protein, partial [Mycobacterium sp.]|nr:oxygenase MpaB family protein [Mycobacterium sp.]
MPSKLPRTSAARRPAEPDNKTTISAAPLGPESLTWKYFGDLRTGMMGVWIGAIQNMYPELGAGVEQHSILLREPLQRVARSVYPIMGVVYDGGRASATGEQIKQ